MVDNVGADPASSTSKTPFQTGGWAPSALVMKPPFVIQDDSYVPGARFEDPIVSATNTANNIIGSPILGLLTLGGVAGLLAAVGLKTHKSSQLKAVTRDLERRFESFDALLDPTSGKSPTEVRHAYGQGVQGMLATYRKLGDVKALPVGGSISADAIHTLHLQERISKKLFAELKATPKNHVAIDNLLSHIERHRRLEISANVILGRMSAISTEARSLRKGTPEWHALADEKRQLEALCEHIEPSTSSLPAHLDLAKRYMHSQMTLAQLMQGLPRLRQSAIRKELQSFYANRQANLSYYLPPDSRFWRRMGLAPSEANDLRSTLGSIQNTRYREQREMKGLRRLRRHGHAAENQFYTAMEKLYVRMSQRTNDPLSASSFGRTGRPRA